MRRLLVPTLAFALTAAACSPSEEGDASTTTAPAESTTTSGVGETTTSASVDVTTTMPESTTTTTMSESTTTTIASAGGGDDCLAGTWILDSEAFVQNFSTIFAEAGMPDASVSALDGTFSVDMSSDGTYEAVRDAWGFSIVMAEGTVTLEINGTETGTWSTDGDVLTINGDISDLTVDTSIEVDGEVIPIPEGQIPVDTPPGIATDSTYDCSGDTLTLSNDGVESVLNRS